MSAQIARFTRRLGEVGWWERERAKTLRRPGRPRGVSNASLYLCALHALLGPHLILFDLATIFAPTSFAKAKASGPTGSHLRNQIRENLDREDVQKYIRRLRLI